MASKFSLHAEDLAAQMCAKLCHDLVGPVSGIGAALDVLKDPTASDMHAHALELIASSAETAWARLEFLRLAMGAAGSAPGRLDVHELKRVTNAMFADARAKLEWGALPDSLEKSAARVMLNLIVLGVEALPFGGLARIEATREGERITVTATGERVRLDPKVAAALEGETPDEGFSGKSNIQPYFGGLLTRRAGGRVMARAEDGKVVFEAAFAPASVG